MLTTDDSGVVYHGDNVIAVFYGVTAVERAEAYVAEERALEAERAPRAKVEAALECACGVIESCRNMLVEYGAAASIAYGLDFRSELTAALARLRVVHARPPARAPPPRRPRRLSKPEYVRCGAAMDRSNIMTATDETVKRDVMCFFADSRYMEMEDGEVLTRLLIALDPWFPDERRPPAAPLPPGLRKPRAYRRRSVKARK